ncbi:MAG: hypothetical protein PHR25_04585 [Clostridia bacterium]|nr:hypothetical protein [Clostridia bacterium]MDD4376041.1 hypothetical protein [Clostridia bacterium]
MGRGKFDDCSNCIYATFKAKRKYICKWDKTREEQEIKWCKDHTGEDE